MANCKSCATRVDPGARKCPNCGHTLNPGASGSGMQPVETPPLTGPSPLSQTQPPQPPPELELAPEPEQVQTKAEIPEPVVEEPDDDTETRSPEPEPEPEEEPMPEKPAARVVKPARPAPKHPAPKPAAEPASLFTLQPDELRARVAERPEMVEPGLQVYRDPDSGKAVGAGYESDVGEIDLLAVDPEGALVLVVVAERGAEPVAPLLERLGWVSKHLANGDQTVRAVVLLEPPAPELGYAARAVADSVSFKTYRVTVALDDVDP